MINNSVGKISIVLVIIFGFIGFSLIFAGIGIEGICIGIIFALPPLLIYIKDKKNEKDTSVNSQIRHERTMMWIFFLVFLSTLILIFSKADFSWGTMWFPIVFSLGFVIYSGYILLKSYRTNKPVSSNKVTIRTFGKNGKTYHSIEEYQNDTNPIPDSGGISYGYDDSRALINNENKYNHDDLERKAKKVINKASAIYMIISGVVWNFIVLNLFYLPRFFQDDVQTTYIRNGVTVTKEEFYSNPTGLIFLVFGFIPIIAGIVMLKKKE